MNNTLLKLEKEYYAKELKEIKMDLNNEFKALRPYYDPYVGNFMINKDFIIDNMELIEKWIAKHNDYVLVYQPMVEYNGNDWFLTNFLE